ncbi:MAG: hypothetical protein IJX34_04760 [Clostridia bacterium]|nr:hypothetical protein [Clostridia bacterium]
MKSKILTIILTLLLLVLLAVLIILSVRSLNLHSEIETLQNRVDELQHENEKEENNEIEPSTTETENSTENTDVKNETETKTKDSVTSFTADDERYLLQLVNYYDRNFLGKTSSPDRKITTQIFHIQVDNKIYYDDYFGYYRIVDNQLELTILYPHYSSDPSAINKIFGTPISITAGMFHATVPYDEVNGTITFDEVTFKIVE